nr:hypothetical protein [Candidatus Sigynarchaeota archaeon]
MDCSARRERRDIGSPKTPASIGCLSCVSRARDLFLDRKRARSAQRTPSRIPGIQHVDRRGKGGIIFAPGCRFEDHDFQPYTIVNDVSILLVSDAKFWEIWDHYAAKRDGEGSGAAKAIEKKASLEPAPRIPGARDFPARARDLDLTQSSLQDPSYPACINAILTCCEKGIHLTHEERWLLASFMVAAGKAEASIVQLFENMPDFNEAISAYQVHHVASHHYKPRNCKTLAAMHICPGFCGRVNPIVFAKKVAV